MYDKQQMFNQFNLAMQTIFNRNNPPPSDCLELMANVIIQIVNNFVDLEDRKKLINNLTKDIKDNIEYEHGK